MSARKISDQLGHSKVSMTQDRYLGRRLKDRETADALEGIIPAAETVETPEAPQDHDDGEAEGS